MKPFYLEPPGGRRLFAVHFPAVGERRGAVLLLPPWGEEMHKSRHVLSRTARGMAQRGFDVLMFDLFGTGDSEGDFGDTSWALWLGDCRCARHWLEDNFDSPLYVWSLRAGSLLLPAVLSIGPVAGALLWQPVTAGKTILTQLLRLKLASGLEAGTSTGLNTAPLLEALRRHESIEIAGYMHAPELLLPLDELVLKLNVEDVGQLLWLELGARVPPEVLPATRRVTDQWKAAGVNLTVEALHGPGFWQSVELESCPALEARSLAWLESMT